MNSELMMCLVPIPFLGAIFGTIVLIRWFKHREIMAMVEKGVLPEQYLSVQRSRRDLGLLMSRGIALAALGLALIIGLWPLGFARVPPSGQSPYPLNFGPWMMIGLIPLFIGLALLIIYLVTRKEEEKEKLSALKMPSEPPESSEGGMGVEALGD